jgi:membrane protein involved in colicin uptake
MTLMLPSFPMRTVIPLRYGTAFKKAFRQPHIFSAFARDILGIEFEAKEVFQEYAFHPPVGRVNIRYDLFAEDPARRVIVEMQHIRDDETLDRFLYYHLIGQVEQVQGSDTYRFQRRVYTVVVLTRLPTKEELKFDVGVLSSKLSTLDGKEIKDFGHRLVFVNARARKEGMPEGVRRWMELIEDSLDEEVDETRYGDPVMREVIEEIQWEKVSEDELFRLKEEAVWENAKEEVKEAEAEVRRVAEEKAKKAEEKAKEEAEARRQAEEKAKEAEEKAKEAEEKAKEAEEKAKEAEEKAKEAEEKAKEAEANALREAIFDLCELLAMELTEAQRSQVGTLDLTGLRELRSALKQQKRWPGLPRARRAWFGSLGGRSRQDQSVQVGHGHEHGHEHEDGDGAGILVVKSTGGPKEAQRGEGGRWGRFPVDLAFPLPPLPRSRRKRATSERRRFPRAAWRASRARVGFREPRLACSMTLMLPSFPMRTVIPLRYGTAFKKAFRQPHIFSAFARDILGIEFEAKEVFQEYAFHPPVGRVNIRYDLFAEDPARRVIVEMQHIRDDETLDRFLYYHLIGQVEQVQGSDTYRFQRRVYTVVVLTRLPTKEELKFDVGVLSSKLSTLDGKEIKDFGHRLVFVNARARKEGMPEGVRRWMELIEDSLDEEVDETRYGDPVMREVIEEIQWEKVSEDELFRLKEEAVWENAKEEVKEAEAEVRRVAEEKAKKAEEKAKEEAEAHRQAEEKAKEAEEKAKEEAEARRQAEEKAKEAEEKAKEAEEKAKEAEEKAKEAEEKAKEAEEKAKKEAQGRGAAEEKALAGAREAIADLCELLSIKLTAAQRAQVEAMDLSGLRQLRTSLKQQKRWPG